VPAAAAAAEAARLGGYVHRKLSSLQLSCTIFKGPMVLIEPSHRATASYSC
jgi:hypothetical protein